MMKTVKHEPDRQPNVAAIAIWENEGGASRPARMDQHFGRRIEKDRTWTIYHVYTGIPATSNGRNMTGLSHSDATDGMLFLNDRNTRNRAHRHAAQAKPRGGLSGFLRTAWRRTGHLPWH